MFWLPETTVLDYLVRVSLAFALGLLLSRVFRHSPRFRWWLWAIVFLTPLLLLLPRPTFDLPISEFEEPTAIQSVPVVELQPHFQSLKPTYLDDPLPGWLFLGVVLGALLGAGVWFGRWMATVRLVRSAEQTTDAELVSMLYEIGSQHGLSDLPVLKTSDRIHSPCIWGVAHPTILVPAEFGQDLSVEEWRMALSHEVAHLASRDPLRLGLFSFIQHVFFWNPLLWLGLRDMILAQEQMVDSRFVGPETRRAYANLLANVVKPVPAMSRLSLAGSSHLLTRIRTIREGGYRKPGLTAWASILAFAPILIPIQPVAIYSPDPTRIGKDEVVFSSNRSGEHRWWRMSLDGRNPTMLPERFAGAMVPSVSPDGKWLAYCRMGEGKEDIYIGSVDGKVERLIMSSPNRDFQPVWSPDGKTLLFCTLATKSWEVAVVDVETRKWRFVTKDGERNFEPRWHPNGTRVIFASMRASVQTVWSIDIDGTDLVQITTDGAGDTGAKYSPDGRYVLYSSTRRSKYGLWLIDLQTRIGRPVTRAHHENVGEANFADGGRIVFASAARGLEGDVARIDLSDSSFRYVGGPGRTMWPVLR